MFTSGIRYAARVADLTDAKRRIVERLKRVEHLTAPELAKEFGLTDTAVRQHLESLEASGLVERATGPSSGRGRPPTLWSLTPLAADLFPDRHADLTVDLIRTLRDTLGDEALDRVIEARTAAQAVAYRTAVPASGPLSVRVARLAAVRSAEGYLAEAVETGGDIMLVEHHCPICDAAAACQGLCRSELDLFRAVLGDDVRVERDQHLLSGDQRCAYRISPVAPAH